jgi:cellulose synthase/poly-beta-1,6-N-acetylglucosamine synthase-like glycosyltransferase
MGLLTLLVSLAAAVLLLPVLSDIACAAQAIRRKRVAPTGAPQPRLLFMVPAHDEALLIRDCLASFHAHSYPRELARVVVIADNCSDDTASIVRESGFECLERVDPDRRGKPHAIAWALEQLPIGEYDSVIIVDADSVIDPDFGSRLSLAAPLRRKAVQAWHGVNNPGESALTRMAEVFAAGRYRYGFRLKGLAGINVPIMGNGMCFGSDVLNEHGWHAYSICEDWEMYALLTEAGVPIEYVPELRVYSQEAKSLDQSASQRKRWTAGKLQVLFTLAPRIMASRRIRALQKLDALAELTAPGPAVLLILALILSAPVVLTSGGSWLVAALWLPVFRQGCYAAVGLASVPDRGRAALAFLFLPFYALWRLGVQLASLGMLGAQPWVRTRRHAGVTPVLPLNDLERTDGN